MSIVVAATGALNAPAVIGLLLFGQSPDGWSAAGMAVIAASGIGLALWERRRMRLM